MTEAELEGDEKAGFIRDIFPSSEIDCYFSLMSMIREFFRFIGSQDRSKVSRKIDRISFLGHLNSNIASI